MSLEHRKRVKHYHEPGDFHELTFSTYRRLGILTSDVWRRWLSASIDAAAAAVEFQVTAFVYMPEHVHLLVLPTRKESIVEDISRFLAGIKRPVSRQVKAELLAYSCNSAEPQERADASHLLKTLTIRSRPGKTSFRFWQEGPGYDRNLNSEQAVMAAIDYIHLNPVRRKLVATACDWKWSSARLYLNDGEVTDPDLPTVHFPPFELFDR